MVAIFLFEIALELMQDLWDIINDNYCRFYHMSPPIWTMPCPHTHYGEEINSFLYLIRRARSIGSNPFLRKMQWQMQGEPQPTSINSSQSPAAQHHTLPPA